MNGDDIYNGAHDNASGWPIVLKVAHAYSTLKTRPRRSVLFLFVTAEERGLLGSDYFARNPTVPRERDRGRPRARHALPLPPAARHRAVRRAALDARPGQSPVRRGTWASRLATDPIPEQVLFIRSDHFSFVRQGVPSLFIKSGFRRGIPSGMAGRSTRGIAATSITSQTTTCRSRSISRPAPNTRA